MKKSNDFPIIIFGDLNEPLRLSYSGDVSGSPEKLDALLVKPGMHPQRITIGNDYDSLRAVVADHLDFIHPCTDNPVTLITNVLGNFDNSEPNRALEINGEIVDLLWGNFLIVGNADSGDFCSLTEKQYEEFEKMFFSPQIFAYRDEQIIAVPIPEYLVIKP